MEITDDPLAYVKKIEKMNEEYRVGRVEYDLKADFNERVEHTDDPASVSKELNIGYFCLQEVMQHLKLNDFFSKATADRRITYDCYTILRFLTYARILDPGSKHRSWEHLEKYYERPSFDYQHILRFMDLLESNMVKSKGSLKQSIIVTFFRKMLEYQRDIRNAQIERARNYQPKELNKKILG